MPNNNSIENNIKSTKQSLFLKAKSFLYCFSLLASDVIFLLWFRLCCLLPLKKQVLGSSFYGKVYGNNTKYVVEKIHFLCKRIPIYWDKTKTANYYLPDYVVGVKSRFVICYLYARSMVVINTHFIPKYFKRRKNQLYIMMYHGGIGIKKNSNSVPGRKPSKIPQINSKAASYIISNSVFMNKVIRECLVFHGPIWMTGYPKNDILHSDPKPTRLKVRKFFGLNDYVNIVIYAPTYRLDLTNTSVFDIDFNILLESLQNRFGGEWVALLHLHPHQSQFANALQQQYGGGVINANEYDDMQELILAADCLISDYSSCIFEAAERNIPCFSYASDYDTYKDVQGFFFDINTLPFPYCKNNIELKTKILDFDFKEYSYKWSLFKKKQGLIETNSSSIKIAKAIIDFIDGKDAFKNEILSYE